MAKEYGTSLRRNKKGSLIDIMFIGVVLLFFAIVVTISLKIATEFEDNIGTNAVFDDLNPTGEARSAVENTRVKFTNTIDNTFLFLTIFLALGTLALAAMVYIHPIFIPFYFIGWVLVIYFTGILSNIYQTMALDANLADIVSQLTFIEHILSALPIIVGVFGIVLMVVMYKLRGTQFG